MPGKHAACGANATKSAGRTCAYSLWSTRNSTTSRCAYASTSGSSPAGEAAPDLGGAASCLSVSMSPAAC